MTIALIHVFLPFVILLLGNLQAINPEVALASCSFMLRVMRTFFKVTLLRPCRIQAGRFSSSVPSISAYVTPVAMLGGTGAPWRCFL